MHRPFFFVLVLIVFLVNSCKAFEPAIAMRSSRPLRSTALEMRKTIIAGNWKLNTDLNRAVSLARDIGKLTSDVKSEDVEIVVIPPFPFLTSVKANVGENVQLGAQHCWYEDSGAYTSAVSASMLKSVGCKYVCVGHSERWQCAPQLLHCSTRSGD